MSQEISHQLIDLERRVRALEDTNTSCAISDLSANTLLREAIIKECDMYFKSIGFARAAN